MKRVDSLLAELGLAESRAKAVEMIKDGRVSYLGKSVKKSSMLVSSEGLKLLPGDDFVGRGWKKIEGALNNFQINVANLVIADIGACTGGFSDFVLQKGAKKVYAVDVGQNQLASKLKSDARVINLEKVNVKHGLELDEKIDLAMIDVSFISVKHILINVFKNLKEDGKVVSLIKPQFEVGKENISKGGIVKDSVLRKKALEDIYCWCEENGIYVTNFCHSPISGKTGNIEYFYLLEKKKALKIKLEEVLV